MTTPFHAVLWIDHGNAQLLHFDAGPVEALRIKAHHHHTAQHGSAVRTEHEFFGAMCDALDGIAEVLVAGHGSGLDDFRRYVGKHRPALAPHIVGYEVVDQPTENQLVAQARRFFLKYDRMHGVPTPT